jgi:WD40 repeat protein
VLSLASRPGNEKIFFSGSGDGFMKVWDTRERGSVLSRRGNEGVKYIHCWDDSRLILITEDNEIQVSPLHSRLIHFLNR